MRKFYEIGGLLRETAGAAAPAGGGAAVAAGAAATVPAADAAAAAAAAAGTTGAASQGDAAAGQAATGTAAAAAATAGATAPVVPDKYTLALPQGSPLDQSDVDSLAAIAKDRKWTQEQASAALQEMHDSQVATSAALLSTLQSHPEVGGANLEAAQRDANAAVDRFLPAESAEGKELRSVLNKSGYGNFAPLVVLLSRIGKAMREDRGIGAAAGGTPVSREAKDVLYGGPPIK